MANQHTRLKINTEKMISLYEEGFTQVEIAKRLGTTPKVIWSRFKEKGYECRVAKKRNQWGENNHLWKGDKVGYSSQHRRVKRLFGVPKRCEVCKTEDKKKKYEWANLTGDYNNPKDYKRMCASCHAKYDKREENFKVKGRA